ncbi:hypothetical protein BKA93DRAFT_749498 [Sparassis latifolia]
MVIQHEDLVAAPLSVFCVHSPNFSKNCARLFLTTTHGGHGQSRQCAFPTTTTFRAVARSVLSTNMRCPRRRGLRLGPVVPIMIQVSVSDCTSYERRDGHWTVTVQMSDEDEPVAMTAAGRRIARVIYLMCPVRYSTQRVFANGHPEMPLDDQSPSHGVHDPKACSRLNLVKTAQRGTGLHFPVDTGGASPQCKVWARCSVFIFPASVTSHGVRRYFTPYGTLRRGNLKDVQGAFPAGMHSMLGHP